jgi:hypothetical protein
VVVMVVLGNNIENIVFPVKQSPFDSKKDLVASCLFLLLLLLLLLSCQYTFQSPASFLFQIQH